MTNVEALNFLLYMAGFGLITGLFWSIYFWFTNLQ